jgi:hypothetical protein
MYDDEGYYVVLPDPETLPEPGYEGMSADQIMQDIRDYEEEAAWWDWYLAEGQYMDSLGW